jgi:heptosyltransferase-1
VRLLLTRLSALGDIVHTWPLAEALHRLPEPVELAWAVEEPLRPLVATHPAVARTFAVATQRWRRRPAAAATRREIRQARQALREFDADVVLDPQGLCKSAAWGWLAGAPRRIGFARPWRREGPAGLFYSRTVAPPPEATHVVDFNLALLEALGAKPPWGAIPDGRFLLAGTRAPVTVRPGTVALVPGAGGKHKAWAPDAFVGLARDLCDRGYPVLVVWGPGESAIAGEIVARAGPGASLAPATGILDLAALLAVCTAVVGGDTGPIHLAASLSVPTVAVFLASDAVRNAPRGRSVRLVCAAATGGSVAHARRRRLREVGVAEVRETVLALLAASAAVASTTAQSTADPAAEGARAGC